MKNNRKNLNLMYDKIAIGKFFEFNLSNNHVPNEQQLRWMPFGYIHWVCIDFNIELNSQKSVEIIVRKLYIRKSIRMPLLYHLIEMNYLVLKKTLYSAMDNKWMQ